MALNPTFASGGKRITKATCPKCKRTVYVVLVGGVRIMTDPELMSVVADGTKAKIFARRSHDENCDRYQFDDAKKKIKAKSLQHAREAK